MVVFTQEWGHFLKEQYSKQIKIGLIETLKEIYPDGKSLRDAALELGISSESARQARDYGKGSAQTMIGLLMHGYKIPPNSLSKNLTKVFKTVEKSSHLATLEKLLEDVISKYGANAITAWLRLLTARYEIERELGIHKKPGRKSRTKSQGQ